MAGARRGDTPPWSSALTQPSLSFSFVALAFGCLTYAFVTSDFSVAVVAANSHTLKPMLYKISGVWGNHEGSMLLWVLILALFGAALRPQAAIFPKHLRPTRSLFRP